MYRSVADGLRADVGRAIAMAAGGALAFAPVEYALTLWAYAGETSLASKLRLVALTATLALILWWLLAALLAVALAGYRIAIDRTGRTGAGLFALAPLRDGIRSGVPRVWAAAASCAVLAFAVQRIAAWAMARFKEPQLTAWMIALLAVGTALAALGLARALRAAVAAGARKLARFGAGNPLGRWRASGAAFAVLAAGGLAACWYAIPQSRSVLPVRLAISAIVVGLGMGFGARRAASRRTGPVDKRRARLAAAGALALVTPTLVWWGAELETKYIAITASPALDKLIGVVRAANDLDRDGFGSLLGEADCAPLTRAVNPGARDVPGDGIDQNCDGRDLTFAELVPPPGPVTPVPAAFVRDWNFLFITIDTVRYDRTSFGGYRDGPAKRDTTPRLAELVRDAANFTFAQAPSAGTIASIPAILTSKFFHSGIAIDDTVPRGTPPKILPENTTLPEIMKRGGYRTGAIGSHEYWTDWGIEQGVDDFDNSIGRKRDDYRVVADKVTDHAIAWISRQQSHKWFMWAHYIDPHGRYVAHPDVIDYGTTEPDLYDAELRWTDQEVGRLLAELRRLPSHRNTIIVITSDHGDSMGEHTVPVGTHGTALYRELLHVPLIFYIPNAPPRTITAAVTPLDVTPTIAALAGIRVDDLQFEGRSLAAELFYGKQDHDRIVFAETNAGGTQRAAISERWKLIYYLNSNLYELFDLRADAWEKRNLAPNHPPELETMKRALSGWMDRVLYARDPRFNQAARRFFGDLVLAAPPAPAVAVTGQQLAGGKLEIIGIGRDSSKPLAAGKTADFHVYFRVVAPPAIAYRFQLAVWRSAAGAPLDAAIAPTASRTPPRVTADGAFPSDRWRAGEFIRERFTVAIPRDWRGEPLALALQAIDVATGERARPTGAAPANEPDSFALGALPAR